MAKPQSRLALGRRRSNRKIATSGLQIVLIAIFSLWIGLNWKFRRQLLDKHSTKIEHSMTWTPHEQDVHHESSQTFSFGNRSLSQDQVWIDSLSTSGLSEQPQQTMSMKPYTCQAGEQRLSFPQAPDFILAGAQKSGTTALFALLEKHPSIIRSQNFEEHFFDMHYGIELEKLTAKYKGESSESIHCRLGKLYTTRLNFESEIDTILKRESTQSLEPLIALAAPSLNSERPERIRDNEHSINDTGPMQKQQPRHFVTFEKTPFYLVWPHIPEAILKTCPWRPKIVIMLRNPVDRLYSHYQMRFIMKQTEKGTLESTLNGELELLHKFGLSQAPLLKNSTEEKISSNQNHEDRDRFQPPPISLTEQDRLDSIQFRGFGNHRQHQRYLQRGMYAIQLTRWLKHFKLNENMLILQYEEFKADPRSSYERVLEFLGITNNTGDPTVSTGFRLSDNVLQRIYRSKSEVQLLKINSLPPPLDPSTRVYLENFYRPYNERLSSLLGNDARWLWRNISE